MARAGEDPIDLTPGAAVAPRRGGARRGGPRHKKATPEPTVEIAPPPEETEPEAEGKPKRRRGSRGGRRHKKATAEAEVAPQEVAAEARPHGTRRTTTR